MSLLRNLLVSNKDVAVKFPSHRLGSARTFALYGITSGEKGLVEVSILLEIAELGASSRETRGVKTLNLTVEYTFQLEAYI